VLFKDLRLKRIKKEKNKKTNFLLSLCQTSGCTCFVVAPVAISYISEHVRQPSQLYQPLIKHNPAKHFTHLHHERALDKRRRDER